MPVKPLSFKGDKKVKKRKHRADEPPSSESQLVAVNQDTKNDDDEAWTHPDTPSDLTGPTFLILPTKPATCLASDAHGNIFASRVENILEDTPSTAEPHDVRQVWVATKVAGMPEGNMCFKGSHGGYLSCDGVGALRAAREAMGRDECFEVIPVDERGEGAGVFALKTAASAVEKEKGKDGAARYLSAVATTTTTAPTSDEENPKTKISVEIRGDAPSPADTSTHIHIRMQARFKPRLMASKEKTASAKISRRELEEAVGRKLEDEEVRRLKRARRDGTYHEEVLDVRVKGKHDKFAS